MTDVTPFQGLFMKLVGSCDNINQSFCPVSYFWYLKIESPQIQFITEFIPTKLISSIRFLVSLPQTDQLTIILLIKVKRFNQFRVKAPISFDASKYYWKASKLMRTLVQNGLNHCHEFHRLDFFFQNESEHLKDVCNKLNNAIFVK